MAMSERSHLLSIDDLGRDGIVEILHFADACAAIGERSIPKVPTLRGKTVATVFFEASTRTRLSFETAAKRLSADTMTFTAATSSLSKGESLRDTVETLSAMGVDAMIVRHSSVGAPARIAEWIDASIINAGDGAHEHPTQALADCFTIRAALGEQRGEIADDLTGVRIAIVGDVKHSRVARSNVAAFVALGAKVTLVGPTTLMPPSFVGWPVEVSTNFDEVAAEADVVYMLRLQNERMREALIPSLGEYRDRFGLTVDRAKVLKENAMIMHPGPMNRGVEIDAEVASLANSFVVGQVKSGVAVRMAVLISLLGAQNALVAPQLATEEPNLTLIAGEQRG